MLTTMHRLQIAFVAMLLTLPTLSLAEQPGANEEGDPTLSVVSFNIRYDNPGDGPNRWRHRREEVAEIIGRYDLAGLQEVVHGQLTDLKQALPGFTSVGVGRTDGKQAGEYCPILYRRDRFELRESGTFWLSTTPEKAGSQGWDARLPRICTWAKLRDKQAEREFFFFNTHFDHRGAKARLESAKLIVTKIDQLAGESPALLTGDFNATPSSEPITALLEAGDRDLPLFDSRTLSKTDPVGPATTWNGFKKIVPDRRIDFVFVRGPLEVESYRELTEQLPDGRFPSDHLPVAVEIGK